MKSYYLEEIDFADIMRRLDDVEEGQIYINSSGGSTWMFDSLLARLEEKRQEGAKIKLRGIWLGSRAFNLFYNYTGEKIIEKGCDGVVHTEAGTYNINSGIIRGNDIEKQRYKCLRFTEPYKFLTKKEKKKFLNGEDIFLSYERLKKIFEKTNNFILIS